MGGCSTRARSATSGDHLPMPLSLSWRYKGGLVEEERGSCFMRVPPLGNVHARLLTVETHD